MADVLGHGPEREPLPRVGWRRTRVVDLLSLNVLAALSTGLLVVAGHGGAVPEGPAAAPPVYGSRPNLDLPEGANLSAAARGVAPRYEQRPTEAGLRAAVDSAVAQLCEGSAVDHVVRESVSGDFTRADVVLVTLRPGVPTKERPESGLLAVRLLFRRDAYEFAASRRSGACAG